MQNQDSLLDNAGDFEHFPFGFLLWESAVALARHIVARPEIAAGRTVLELGCGVGVVGMVAHDAGAAVTQTDHQKGALQVAAYNAGENGVIGIRQFAADWRSWTHAGVYDVIVGADITYDRLAQFHIEAILRQNLASGGVVIISDPGRPQTLEFAAALERRGWQIAIETMTESLGEIGQAGMPVDVAILTLTPP